MNAGTEELPGRQHTHRKQMAEMTCIESRLPTARLQALLTLLKDHSRYLLTRVGKDAVTSHRHHQFPAFSRMPASSRPSADRAVKPASGSVRLIRPLGGGLSAPTMNTSASGPPYWPPASIPTHLPRVSMSGSVFSRRWRHQSPIGEWRCQAVNRPSRDKAK